MKYLFGDTDLAARRLEVLARVYRESTRLFLDEAVGDWPALAVDLGCGPGLTTHLLAATLTCQRTVGLDSSEHFIALAQRAQSPSVSFMLHDVTAVPFPVEEIDLIYCRFLMTHLTEPRRRIEQWGDQLRPGGLLLIEEVDWLETGVKAFSTYLSIVEEMLRTQSTDLYIGRCLESMDVPRGLVKRSSRDHRLPVTDRDAATMFSMNIPNWRERPFIRENYSPKFIGDLERELEALANAPGDRSNIEWGLRQIVFERSGSPED